MTSLPRPEDIRQIRLLPYKEELRVFEREETRRILRGNNDKLTGRAAGTEEDQA
jgi:hypothetical protein